MKPISTTIAALILVILTGFDLCHAAETKSDWTTLLKRSTDLFAAKQRDQALLVADSALQAAIAANGDRDSSVAMCWHRISGIASDMGNPKTDSLFRQTFAAWDRVANPNQVERAKTLSNYGGWLNNQGRYEEAMDILNECLKIRNKLLPADHVDIARVEHKIGQNLVIAGKPASAIPHLEKAVEIFKLKGKSALA